MLHVYGRYEDCCKLDKRETWDEERGSKGKDQDTQGCGREETCDEERRIERKDQDTQRCNHEETCNIKCELEEKDQDLHDYNKDKDNCKLTRSARDLQGYDRDKDYSENKRRNEALHGCATLESRDGKRSWDQDSHSLNCDDEYDRFNESHEQGEKLGRDETFTFKRGDGDYDDNNRECIIDGESDYHEKNDGYVDMRFR